MAAEFREDHTWVGLGIKGGGHLFVVGVEGTEGIAGRLDQFSNSLTSFNITSMRMGPGLGGGAGLCLFMAFNTPMLSTLNGTKVSPSLSDFNVNISVELKVPLGNSFKALKPIAKRFAAGSRFFSGMKSGIGKLSMDDISTLRDFAHIFWQANIEGSEAMRTSPPKTIVIDIPGAGAGLELSLYWTAGEITVT